jgi:hypothetical protein
MGLGLAGWGFRRISRMLALWFSRRVFPPGFRALRICSSRILPPWVQRLRLRPWGVRRRLSRWCPQSWELGYQVGRLLKARSGERPKSKARSWCSVARVDKAHIRRPLGQAIERGGRPPSHPQNMVQTYRNKRIVVARVAPDAVVIRAGPSDLSHLMYCNSMGEGIKSPPAIASDRDDDVRPKLVSAAANTTGDIPKARVAPGSRGSRTAVAHRSGRSGSTQSCSCCRLCYNEGSCSEF